MLKKPVNKDGMQLVDAAEAPRLKSSGEMIAEIISRFAETKISFPLFAVISFFCFVVSARIGGFNAFDIAQQTNEACCALYLCDYNIGFSTRFLVGAVLGLFTDKVSPTLVYTIGGTTIIISFVLQAIIAAAVLKKSLIRKEYAVTLLTMVFLLHSLTSIENIRIKGCLDTFILILFLLWLMFYDSVVSVVSAPAVCVIAMLIHYSYIFTFMPPVLALVFYCIFFSESRKKRISAGVFFSLGCILTISLFVYFVFFANDHLRMTSDECYDYLVSRFALTPIEEIHMKNIFDGNVLFRVYIDCYFFNKDRQLNQLGGVKDELELIRNEVINYVPGAVYLKYAAVFVPLFIVFVILWIACMRKVRGTKKLPYIVFICMPVVLLPSNLMSSDVWRWVSAAIIAQFSVFFALYKKGDDALLGTLQSGFLQRRAVKAALGLLTAVYICFALWFGTVLPITH